jgi:hypothetical protein
MSVHPNDAHAVDDSGEVDGFRLRGGFERKDRIAGWITPNPKSGVTMTGEAVYGPLQGARGSDTACQEKNRYCQ